MSQVHLADLSSEKDSKAIVQLLNVYATDLFGGGQPLVDYTRENLVEELRKRPTCHVLLASVDEEPAGLAICFEAFSTFLCRPILNIHDFAVAPEFRGRGISKDLLAKVEEQARRLGCCKITLEVLEHNEIARSVYAGFGFRSYELDPKMGRALFYEKKLMG
ncbi:GNAT family N-acetyltransferase [Haloferula sp.]|uniref:GNAT family N-acetyltransferase n=1 Tax=Haloferula sp. TaxID=2497595 RepID=UPI0032A11F77